MGDTDKSPTGSYRFIDHRRYLDAWFDAMDLKTHVTLVLHDWGSALGFDWANRNQDRIKGIVYMEAIVQPLTWEMWPELSRNNPGEARLPTLTWPREIPIDGVPEDVHNIVGDYARWLQSSPIRKLFINADPGAILIGSQREFCRTWSNQDEVTVPGIHFLQEDCPEDIGQAIGDWYASI